MNGVWATAPYLHNGSVPTLKHLLGNPSERPTEFLLGDPTFDTENVGIQVTAPSSSDKLNTYTEDGWFILRTGIPGNSHRGHEFRDEPGEGRIGPALSAQEVDALVEFLKTF